MYDTCVTMGKCFVGLYDNKAIVVSRIRWNGKYSNVACAIAPTMRNVARSAP